MPAPENRTQGNGKKVKIVWILTISFEFCTLIQPILVGICLSRFAYAGQHFLKPLVDLQAAKEKEVNASIGRVTIFKARATQVKAPANGKKLIRRAPSLRF